MAQILLVDDDDDLRESVTSLLQEEGHDVVTACDGADALEVLSHVDPPGVALVDLLMPKMGGLELIKRMRSDPRLASVPVVVISSSTTIRHPIGTTALSKVNLREPLLMEIGRLCGAS